MTHVYLAIEAYNSFDHGITEEVLGVFASEQSAEAVLKDGAWFEGSELKIWYNPYNTHTELKAYVTYLGQDSCAYFVREVEVRP